MTTNTHPLTTPVWLDSTPDDERNPQLALQADHIAGTWNGHPIPAVTAAEFARFIDAHAANDPHGAWVPGGVVEHAVGWLTYDDLEHADAEGWEHIGTDMHGNALYAIDGWTWAL